MKIQITDKRSATPEEWVSIWNNCDYATYFHSPEWAEIWQKYTQGKMRPDAKLIMFSDGKSALLSFSSQRVFKGLVKKYILSPAGTYGGWISGDNLSDSHAELLHKYIMSNCKNLEWRLNPYNALEAQLNIKDVENDETHTLDLECGFDFIYKRWTKGHASAARKARKAGVEIREATVLQDWVDYYKIYEDSLMRWGGDVSSRYDWEFFENIYEISSANNKLWLALFEGHVIAGALCFYARKHVVYWHGAASSEYFKLRPVNLLMYEIIKKSCNDGYQWFDFNPSGGHEGVRNFKKSFGATPRSCPVIQVNSSRCKMIAGVASRIRR